MEIKGTKVTDEVISTNLLDVAKSRAAKYVHDRKPQGVGVDEVKDDILLEFVNRRDAIMLAVMNEDIVAFGDLVEEAITAATNKASNEGHKHVRKLVPFQVRNAGAYLEDKAWEDLARDMADYFSSQSKRETEAWFVRCAIRHLSRADRRIAQAYMELGSWEKVANRFGMSEGHFRRHVLPGFIARFTEEWARCR